MKRILFLVLALSLVLGATFVFALDGNETDVKDDEKVQKTKSYKKSDSTKSIEEKLEAGLISEEQAELLRDGATMKDVFANGKITPEMLQWKVDSGYLTRDQADQIIAGTADIGDFLDKYKD